MKLILIAFLTITLTGCSWFNTKPIVIHSKPVDRIPLILPNVDRLYKRETKWIVITPDNADEVFASLRKSGLPIAIIGVTGEGYKILGASNGDKMQLIKQLQSQINAYKKYYIAVEERDEAHNIKAEEEAKSVK